VTGFDLVFWICLSGSHCERIQLPVEDMSELYCVHAAPALVAKWVSDRPRYKEYGVANVKCYPFGSELPPYHGGTS